MTVSTFRRALPALLVVVATACGSEPPALRVGPVEYTEEELLGLSDARLETLIGLTALGLAVADSTTAELGASRLAEWTDDRLIEILAAELTLEKHGVGDDVLEARYRLDPDWELTVRHMLVFSERWRPEEHREAAEAKVARGLAMLESGSDFAAIEAALAAEEGHVVREGTMPPGREGTWVPEFWSAALALRPGQLSPVTETRYGFHVLRLEERRRVPFEEARSAVARDVAASIESPGAPPRRAAALAEARERGLVLTPADEAEILRRWEDQVAEWAFALGFTYGLTPEGVGRAALAALARTGQNADIARRELAGFADLLRARYPVHVGTP